jgi:hypothetical protein
MSLSHTSAASPAIELITFVLSRALAKDQGRTAQRESILHPTKEIVVLKSKLAAAAASRTEDVGRRNLMDVTLTFIRAVLVPNLTAVNTQLGFSSCRSLVALLLHPLLEEWRPVLSPQIAAAFLRFVDMAGGTAVLLPVALQEMLQVAAWLPWPSHLPLFSTVMRAVMALPSPHHRVAAVFKLMNVAVQSAVRIGVGRSGDLLRLLNTPWMVQTFKDGRAQNLGRLELLLSVVECVRRQCLTGILNWNIPTD